MPNNLKNTEATQFTSGTKAAESGRKGGIASGKAKRERRAIAESLRLVLAEPANNDGLTRQELIVAKVVKRLYDEGDIRDLKTLADILGENVQTINVTGVAPIVAKDAKDAAEIQAFLDSVAARQNKSNDGQE